jgi:predicted cupin superfamily sugar epimerase
MTAAAELIDRLALIPHPEGGFYREVYRAPTTFVYLSEQKERRTATSIYYLLRSQDRSAFHRLTSDEVWYFHAGSPLTLYLLHESTGLSSVQLGVETAQQAQIIIPAGVWFGARVTVPDSFCLVSCMVTPGFDFADFEMADRAALVEQFPEHQGLIEQLT